MQKQFNNKKQLAILCRDALDWLLLRGMDKNEYQELYEDLVEGIPQMSDEQFNEYIKNIEEAKVFG